MLAKQFNPEKDVPNLSGKVVLVTGGNTGLGFSTILQLAPHNPSKIYLAARTPSKAESAIQEIRTKVPDVNIEYLPLDLQSFSSIRSAAETFTRSSPRLDLLINNAGVMMTPYSLTKEGYENQFGTNHVGHALLTKLLMPVLLKTAEEPNADVRIITVSSMGHMLAPSKLEFDQQALEKKYTWTRYGQSKLSNILFAKELAKRYPNITSVALHPGVIITDLYLPIQTNWLAKYSMWFFAKLAPLLPGTLPNAWEGAKNQVWAATAKGVKSGAFYVPVGKESSGSGMARDEGLAKKLWEWTEGEFGRHGV